VQFYDEYMRAQADPHAFMYPGQNKELSVKSFRVTRKRGSSSHMAKRCGNKLLTLVHNRIVDLTFPGLVLGGEDIGGDESQARRKDLEEKGCQPKSQELESKWEAVVGAGEASRLGNPAATTDRSPRPPVSQTRLANDVNDHGVLRFYAIQADNNCSSMRMMKESTLSRF